MKEIGEDSSLGDQLKASEWKCLLSKTGASMTVTIILSTGIREKKYIWDYLQHQ